LKKINKNLGVLIICDKVDNSKSVTVCDKAGNEAQFICSEIGNEDYSL
jgi:hypothetical protein